MEGHLELREKRNFSRVKVSNNQKMKVYTSTAATEYTVDIIDISRNGAFLRGKQLPKIGEIVTFELCDDSSETLYIGTAQVSRLSSEGRDNAKGFAIRFDEVLADKLFSDLPIKS